MQKQNQANASKKKKRNNKSKQKAGNQKKDSNQRPRAHLSECSYQYALAMSNPWACQSSPCVPDQLVLPSYKFSVRSRGTLSVGTAGVGYVVFAPKRFGNDFSAATNFPIYSTASNFTGTTISTTTGVTGVLGTYMSRFPYTTANIGSGVGQLQIRTVGSGLRVFYTGTELNRSGTLLAFREPNNATVSAMSATDIYSLNNTRSVPVDRRKHAVCWVPSSADDYEYADDPHNVTSANGAPNQDGPTCMGIMITGATAGITFDYEIISHYEALGTLLNSTRSESDGVGLSAVHSAIPRVIDTISSVFSKEVISGAYKAIELASGLYFGPAGSTAYSSLEYALKRPIVETIEL